MPGIDSAVRTVIGAGILSTSILGASATYTGPTINGGSESEAWATRVRPVIRHVTSARSAHGYLILEESWDGTLWIETRRAPIPADGDHHTFDWPLHAQYHRLKFTNGVQSQTGMRLAVTNFRGEGGSIDEHQVLTYLMSTTALAASATFTSPVLDLGGNGTFVALRAFARADKASDVSGFRIEWSDDQTNWDTDWEAAKTLNGDGCIFIESRAIARYARIRFTNAATAQTVMRVRAALVSI